MNGNTGHGGTTIPLSKEPKSSDSDTHKTGTAMNTLGPHSNFVRALPRVDVWTCGVIQLLLRLQFCGSLNFTWLGRGGCRA